MPHEEWSLRDQSRRNVAATVFNASRVDNGAVVPHPIPASDSAKVPLDLPAAPAPTERKAREAREPRASSWLELPGEPEPRDGGGRHHQAWKQAEEFGPNKMRWTRKR